MPYKETEIKGAYIFTPWIFNDARGGFHESFKIEEVKRETGVTFNVSQVNNSTSRKGALRGIHLKQNPPGQRKFISVHQGAIFDVIVDLRRSSPTFGRWLGLELNSSNQYSLLLDSGIGHGFLSLEANTVVSYLVDTKFEPELERTINPLSFGIDWVSPAKERGIETFTLSDRDRDAIPFNEALGLLPN